MTEINDYINNDFKALNSQETIADVQDFFADVSYSHFSVVEEGIYIGCIAADDIDTFDSDKKIIDYKKKTLEMANHKSYLPWFCAPSL